MGLDMYLTARRYVSEFEPQEKNISVAIGSMFPDASDFPVCEVTFEVAYWRKANAIHNWFVKNVQNGNDDCEEYYVPREKLDKLLNTVRLVLNSHTDQVAADNLPTMEGFFFGGTEYDEWYHRSLEYTVKMLEKVLALPYTYSFYYHSSW